MIQAELTDKWVLWVPVPEGAIETHVTSEFGVDALSYYDKNIDKWVSDDLPPSNWQLIGLNTQMTEEMANKVVEGKQAYSEPRFKSYKYRMKYASYFFCSSALESYATLEQSHSITGTCAVLVKMK